VKRVIFTSPFVPAEFIEAHGLTPSRIISGGTGRSTSFDHIEGLCPYAQAFLSDVCQETQAAAAVLVTTCDQMRRVADLIRRESPLPLFLMNVPWTWQTPGSGRLYRSELGRLGRFLVQLGGRSPSTGEMASAMRRHDDCRRDLRAARGRVSARRYAEALGAFIRDGHLALDEGATRPPADGIPLALVGGPLPPTDFWLFDEIERLGGRVVLDGSESGERTLPAPFDRRRLADDPLGMLVDAYWGTIPDAFQRPNSRLYAWLKRELEQCGARGLIVRHYVWCDIWHAEAQRMAEWAGIPVLHIDVERGSLSKERTSGRLEAFLEVFQ
jgi:benzoyl-CoA reductase/2-hydroxyglutaryl-CoA dehydratase subunit BcrC/BadD/HgdB